MWNPQDQLRTICLLATVQWVSLMQVRLAFRVRWFGDLISKVRILKVGVLAICRVQTLHSSRANCKLRRRSSGWHGAMSQGRVYGGCITTFSIHVNMNDVFSHLPNKQKLLGLFQFLSEGTASCVAIDSVCHWEEVSSRGCVAILKTTVPHA